MSTGDVNEDGVFIIAPKHRKIGDSLKISGKYRIPLANETVPKKALQFPKHIVLVVTRSGSYAATKPFKNIVVFEDDVKDVDDYAIGQFNLNVFEHIQFNGAGDYYILCSIGNYLSNIVKVTVS